MIFTLYSDSSTQCCCMDPILWLCMHAYIKAINYVHLTLLLSSMVTNNNSELLHIKLHIKYFYLKIIVN